MACNGDGVEQTEEKGACHGCPNCRDRKQQRRVLKARLFPYFYGLDPVIEPTPGHVEQMKTELRGMDRAWVYGGCK